MGDAVGQYSLTVFPVLAIVSPTFRQEDRLIRLAGWRDYANLRRLR